MSEEYSEQVFDYLISESLEGPEPPDLTERILLALADVENAPVASNSNERGDVGTSTARPFVSAELVESLSDTGSARQKDGTPRSAVREEVSVSVEDINHTKEVVAPPVQLDRSLSHRDAYSSEKLQIRVLTGLVMAISACLAYVVIGMPGWPTDASSGDGMAEVGGSDEQPLVPGEVARVDSRALVDSNPEKERSPTVATSETQRTSLDLDDLPFEDPAGVRIVESASKSSSGKSNSVAAMEPTELVREVDSKLRGIWDSLGIEPSALLVTDARLARVSETLIGKPAAGEPATKDLSKVVNTQVNSAAFADHWAGVITADWMKRSALPGDAPAIKSLRRYLARSIRNGTGWNEVVEQVLGGEIRFDQQDASKSTPAGVLAASWGGNSNHRFVSRIGAQFLDASIACSRCHDAKSTLRTGELDRMFASQSSYYETVGLLKGIESGGNGYQAGRSVNDRQVALRSGKLPELFFERPDGRMSAVNPRLPGDELLDLKSKQFPRRQFANWAASSELSDRATVNNAWRLVFGRYLLPQVRDVDVVALEARTEILDLLQRQFVAHNRDMGKLVSWLVQSDAFALEGIGLDDSRWASASDEELATMQLKEIAFAARQSLGQSPEARNVERSVKFVVDLDASKLDQMKTLAQANTLSDAGKKKSSQSRSDSSPASYLLYGQTPTAAEQQYLSSILTNEDLDWDLKVQHVTLLSQFEVGNSRTLETAKRLREHFSGDEEKTLKTMLWSVKNSSAF
ncbi:MAG: DUF1553 domain-containing protein [Aureliella sp.]